MDAPNLRKDLAALDVTLGQLVEQMGGLEAELAAMRGRVTAIENVLRGERLAIALAEVASALCGNVDPDRDHNVATQLGRIADHLEPIAKRIERGY